MNGKKKRAEKKAKPKAAEGVLPAFSRAQEQRRQWQVHGEWQISRQGQATHTPGAFHPGDQTHGEVGESDPERLAMLLSRLLGQEKEKQRLAQDDFDRMVWDIVHKDDETSDTDESAENN